MTENNTLSRMKVLSRLIPLKMISLVALPINARILKKNFLKFMTLFADKQTKQHLTLLADLFDLLTHGIADSGTVVFFDWRC